MPSDDWVIMCGSNGGANLKIANGVDVGCTGGGCTGGTGGTPLVINDGRAGANGDQQTSDFDVAEIIVWDRGLTAQESGCHCHCPNHRRFLHLHSPPNSSLCRRRGVRTIRSNMPSSERRPRRRRRRRRSRPP